MIKIKVFVFTAMWSDLWAHQEDVYQVITVYSINTLSFYS